MLLINRPLAWFCMHNEWLWDKEPLVMHRDQAMGQRENVHDLFLTTFIRNDEIYILWYEYQHWRRSYKMFIFHCRDKAKMREILDLHIVRDRLNTDKIKQGNAHSVMKYLWIRIDRSISKCNHLTNFLFIFSIF